ncbi:MAG: hypothetical protein H0U74_16290 [Bradymonadaceae bacterium]|nr:hypothetical protein [Lujinxingiaceae bacterium]
MRFFESGQRVEFQPPSDFVGDEGGSGKKRIWKYVGIGCAGVLLIVGLLMGLGAFRAVSCCSDLVDVGKRSIEANQFAQSFAQTVYEGKLDEAYAMTSEAYRKEVSREGFDQALSAHEQALRTSPPMVFNIQVRASSDDAVEANHWDVSVRFAPPEGSQMVVMNVGVGWSGAAGEQHFAVSQMSVERRLRDLTAEAPAQEVVALHRDLRSGNYEAAYKRLSQGFAGETESDGFEAFRAFVAENEALLTRESLEVFRVEYESPQRAVVSARMSAPEQPAQVVGFLLVGPGAGWNWRVESILPGPTVEIEAVQEVEADESEHEAPAIEE